MIMVTFKYKVEYLIFERDAKPNLRLTNMIELGSLLAVTHVHSGRSQVEI